MFAPMPVKCPLCGAVVGYLGTLTFGTNKRAELLAAHEPKCPGAPPANP